MTVKLALAAAAAIAVSGPAFAATLVATPGSGSYVPSGSVYDFNTGTRHQGGYVSSGSVSNVQAEPLGNTGDYWVNYPDGHGYTEPGIFDVTGLKTLSFIWGSVDPSNVLSLFDTSGNFVQSWSGNDLLGDTSGSPTNPNGNPLIKLVFGSANEAGHLEFSTNQIAFETGTFSLGVPEPGTWALMILGFGLVGGALRRRQRQSVRYSFA
jgi:hypothetical protein